MNHPHPVEASSADSVDLGAVIRTLLKRWPSILLLTLLSILVSGFILVGETKIYSAQLTIKIDPSALRPLGRSVQSAGDSWGAYWTNKEYSATQYKLMGGRALAEEVARELALNRDPHFMQGVGPGGKVNPSNASASLTDAAQVLRGRVTVEPEEETRLVVLRYEDADPKRAQRIVSAIGRVYIRRNLDFTVNAIGSASDWLNQELDKLRKELADSEMSLHDYKKDNKLISASLLDKSNMLGAEMTQLHQALTRARTLREGLAARVAQLEGVDEEKPEKLSSPELLENLTLRTLRETYLRTKATLSSLEAAGKGTEHPLVKEAEASRMGAHAALVGEISNLKRAAKAKLQTANSEISGLRKLYDDAEKRAFDVNLLEIEYKRLTRTKNNTERLHAIVLERSRESELNSRMRFNNISVVDSALLPTAPVRPRVPLGLAAGGIIGAFLGIALALLRGHLDQRLRGPEDVEKSLGLTCIGTIPLWKNEGASMLSKEGPSRKNDKLETFVHQSPSSPASEAVRSLRTNILFLSPDRPYQKLLITSPSPNAGKTTVACSIAISLAQSGKKVLIVDADLRRPRLSSLFKSDNTNGGLTTALLEPDLLDSQISETGIDGLQILRTGFLPPNPAEVLHSQRFEELFERLSEKFEHIIIDSPPLMPVTDAAILSRVADATLMVLRDSVTRRDHARQAIRSLRDVGANLPGAILNGVDVSAGYGYYQYYAKSPQTPS